MTRQAILRLNDTRVHEIRNSVKLHDVYRYLRQKKYIDVNEQTFRDIINNINIKLAESLLEGYDIKLPRMGIINVRKIETYVKFEDGKIKTNRTVDWDRTLKLWESDDQYRLKKTLIRTENKEAYKIIYSKSTARFNNQKFFKFNPNRTLKRSLKDRIKEGKFDAFKL